MQMIQVIRQAKTIQEGINNLIEASKLDFKNRYPKADAEYKVVEGKKYIKIIRDSSAHSFIVKEDDGKFKKGDILMASTWTTPAKNQARGNLFTGFYIEWTGAIYLDTKVFYADPRKQHILI